MANTKKVEMGVLKDKKLMELFRSVHPENNQLLYETWFAAYTYFNNSEDFNSSLFAFSDETEWGKYALLHPDELRQIGFPVVILNQARIGSDVKLADYNDLEQVMIMRPIIYPEGY